MRKFRIPCFSNVVVEAESLDEAFDIVSTEIEVDKDYEILTTKLDIQILEISDFRKEG